MGFLGRKSLGQYVPIPMPCRDDDGEVADPSAAPTYSIYPAGSDTPVTGADDKSIPPFALGVLDSMFCGEHRLDSNFSAGRYDVLVQYTSTGAKAEQHYFEVVGGGDDQGAYLALTEFRVPHAQFLVGQTDDGSVEARKSPHVT